MLYLRYLIGFLFSTANCKLFPTFPNSSIVLFPLFISFPHGSALVWFYPFLFGLHIIHLLKNIQPMTRKIRQKKDEIEQGARSRQSKDRNTNARVAAVAGAKRTKSKPVSKGKEKATGKRATTADPEAQVKPSRKGITGKKNKGTDSPEYKQKNTKASRSNWESPIGQVFTHNPGRIYNEQNTRGLGHRKTEQNARNISGEQIYEHGAGVYGEDYLYGTNQSTSQYPPFDREGRERREGFRDEFNYDDHYWWEGQFPQGASSWEGDSRWQHHARDWSHRQNLQGQRYNAPYGGDYEKYTWLQNRNKPRHSDDYNEGRSRGNMRWGEAIYPDDQRMREDIYQDPGHNYDRDRSGYTQAYAGATDVGRVPSGMEWDDDRYEGGSHYHRDDLEWDNWDTKRRDTKEFESIGGREGRIDRRRENDFAENRPGGYGRWTARDEYRPEQYNAGIYESDRGGRRSDNDYHSRSINMRDRIIDYMEENDDNRGMRTVWTNSLDTPYEGGYNERTPQSDMRIGTGGYNQGGYGAQGYSYEYGNAGGYGSTGAYQTGHRGEHRRGDYHEGFRYAARQDELKEREEPRNYDRSYIVGSDEDTGRDINTSYQARMNDRYRDTDTAQFSGQVHGIQRYGEGEGSKWKNLGKSNRTGK